MKLAGRTRSEDFWQNVSILCMVLILVMVGPLMLLFRSYLWGSMSHAEQIATGGSPERSLFVVWPYFIGLVVGFPLLAMVLWYQAFDQKEKCIVEKEKCRVIISGIIIVLHITGLLLWDMKLDNSVLVNVSGLTCSIPIIIGLALCTFYPCMHGVWRMEEHSRHRISRTLENLLEVMAATFCHFVCVVSLPLTFVILLIHQFDYGLEIKIWVYPVVCFGIIFGCGGCGMFLVSFFDGMGDS